MAPLASVLARIEAMRGHLFPWTPVFLGSGIGVYFALPVEPSAAVFAGLVLAALGLGLAGWRLTGGAGPLLIAAALAAAGVVLAGERARIVAGPVLGFRYYGPVEGRIVKIDRSQSDAVRLTLDRVRLDDVAPARTPHRVRVSLHGTQGFAAPEPGLTVILTGHLSAPEGPVEPGGFDFRRMAWFDRIGAVGYTRTPVLALEPAAGTALAVTRLRARISAFVQAALPGEAGAFAAAVTTGDRSGMSRATLADLRGANLAHLLAISGLHMGLLTGFVYAAIRLILALIPLIALRFPTRKIAAVVALAAGAFYLALSGGNVATQRAFIMIAAMFVAVLMDRRALTLRSVALAALIVLVLQPEALTEPGFQMSFSATTALVAVFGALRDLDLWHLPRWLRGAAAVVVSSAVAGAATAPFSAAHFNQLALYGFPANLAAVPVMGLVVMPGAVLAAVLAPVGLSWLGLMLMKPGILWILAVAHKAAGMDGALGHVPSPPAVVLPLVALGGLVVILWRGRLRWAGLVPLATAAALWGQVERPALLVSPSGGLVGVLTAEGRVLNKPRGEGFAASVWLENDGDGADQAGAAARTLFTGDKGNLTAALGATTLVHLSGRGAVERVAAACAGGGVVVLAGTVPDAVPGDCLLIDGALLKTTGALAFYAEGGGWRIEETIARSGVRPWTGAR